MAYAYMAFGARVLHLSHHGMATSLPSRITVDICWYSLSRRTYAVVAHFLLLVFSMPAALLRLDQRVHDAAADVLFVVLDPLLLWATLQRRWSAYTGLPQGVTDAAGAH
eukprot:5816374-Pleurochrysis_carterae.AAC.1